VSDQTYDEHTSGPSARYVWRYGSRGALQDQERRSILDS